MTLDVAGHRVLLPGMRYAGEMMKKTMFSAQNFPLREAGMLSIYCSVKASPAV